MVASGSAVNKLSSFGVARSTIEGAPLDEEEARKTHAFWRACNYLAVGMIYLQANALLREPLKPEHIKNRMLGHWGASPALSFIYTHLNRVIKSFDLDMIFMAGPGHGAPGVLGRSISKVRTRKSIRIRARTKKVCCVSSRSFRFPAASGVTARRRRRARFTRAGNSATCCHTPAARFRQSGSDRRGGCWRWRGGNRTTRHFVAHQQVSESDSRRRGAADPQSERLQDQQSDAARAHQSRGVGRPVQGLRVHAAVSSKAPIAESMHQAMAATLDHCVRSIRRASKRSAQFGDGEPSALAHDRSADAEGLDRAGGSRRAKGRRFVASTSGAAAWCEEEPGASETARTVDARLQTRRIV